MQQHHRLARPRLLDVDELVADLDELVGGELAADGVEGAQRNAAGEGQEGGEREREGQGEGGAHGRQSIPAASSPLVVLFLNPQPRCPTSAAGSIPLSSGAGRVRPSRWWSPISR